MLHKTIIGLATAAALILTVAYSTPLQAGGERDPALRDPSNPFPVEPILIFDVAGSSFIGETNRHAAIYNNGQIVACRSGVFGVASAVHYVDPLSVETLRRQLIAAGAMTLPDQPTLVTDMPLTTVTFFAKGRPQACANTFSYFVPENAAAADQIIATFLATAAPSF